jgi:hypothetical protein
LSRPAPYPADTRAKGWRFELNYEQIDQSDTWGLAGAKAFEGLPLARPLLLAMWYAAWKQTPCGTLPADDTLIAAAIGIPAAVFADYRDVLMRGWWLADDGRLYHDTLADRVLEMVESRGKNAKRVANFKAAQREQREGNALPACESHSNNDTGTGTGTNTSQDKPVKKPRKAQQPGPECPADVDPQVWSDWLDLRRKKRATVSVTAIDGARNEAGKAGMTFDAFLRVWCRRGSQGLEASWLRDDERKTASSTTINRQEAIEQRNHAVGDAWLREQKATA